MSRPSSIVAAALAGALAFVVAEPGAGGKRAAGAPRSTPVIAGLLEMPGALSPQDVAAAKSGPEHEVLKLFAGDWDALLTERDAQTGKTIEWRGTQSSVMFGNGMWLVSTYRGKYRDGDYESQGFWGYDPKAKAYVSVWIDSRSPTTRIEKGSWDAATKTLTIRHQHDDGTNSVETIRKVDDDHIALAYESTAPDGKRAALIQIAYSRRK